MVEGNIYCVFIGNGYYDLSLKELVTRRQKQNSQQRIWSARLSTGLFGLTNCRPGNRGPKDYKEILLAEGDGGLRKLVELGFITCPACKPEAKQDLWTVIGELASQRYGLNCLEDFVDKAKLPFDARRLSWEEILPAVGAAPNRLYLPQGLQNAELLDLEKRFEKARFDLPPAGYYDASAPGRFREYNIIYP
jgi:hypothetical protein